MMLVKEGWQSNTETKKGTIVPMWQTVKKTQCLQNIEQSYW